MSRIILRDYLLSDVLAVHAYTSLPETCKYDDWEPMTEATTQLFITKLVEQANISPRYQFDKAIILQDKLIGGVAIRRDAPNSCIAHLSYALNPLYKGQGYATEAVQAILAFGFNELNLDVIYGICEVENMASELVMERAGLEYVGELLNFKYYKGKHKSFFRYEIARHQYYDVAY